MAVQAQTVYKVDINEWSRTNMDEVLEPDFTPWQTNNENENGHYNLFGQRTNGTAKGIVIRNGKKTINR